MDLLGWMYENGRGVAQDKRRAYTWYERAKLAGAAQVLGQTQEIFKELTPPDQFYAELQLAEDIERMKQETETALKRFESVKLHVLKQQRELDSLRKRYKRDKRRVKAIHR